MGRTDGTTATTAIDLDFQPDVLVVSRDGTVPWSMTGGRERDEEIVFHVVVAHPTEPQLSARVTVTVPMQRDGERFVVGQATVEAA